MVAVLVSFHSKGCSGQNGHFGGCTSVWVTAGSWFWVVAASVAARPACDGADPPRPPEGGNDPGPGRGSGGADDDDGEQAEDDHHEEELATPVVHHAASTFASAVVCSWPVGILM